MWVKGQVGAVSVIVIEERSKERESETERQIYNEGG